MRKILLTICIVVTLSSCAHNVNHKGGFTPPIDSEIGITSLEKIEIGNYEQWVLIRGENINNPLLLVLHGGPGSPCMYLRNSVFGDLEKHFTVIYWEQRGAGKSFNTGIPFFSMNIPQFYKDTHELMEVMLEKFNQKKMYIAGWSWGTVLGLEIAEKYPELLYAYLGIGQVVNLKEAEKISYQWALNKAYEEENSEAIKDLEKIGPPPYLWQTMTQRKWLKTLGGMYTTHWPEEKWRTESSEYTEDEIAHFDKANIYSYVRLWGEVLKLNFLEKQISLECPVYLIIGKNDFITPAVLVEQLYNRLNGDQIELIYFENSGHGPHVEEPEEFYTLVVDKILPETYNIQL